MVPSEPKKRPTFSVPIWRLRNPYSWPTQQVMYQLEPSRIATIIASAEIRRKASRKRPSTRTKIPIVARGSFVKCERHIDAAESSERDVLVSAGQRQAGENRGLEAQDVVAEQHREDD